MIESVIIGHMDVGVGATVENVVDLHCVLDDACSETQGVVTVGASVQCQPADLNGLVVELSMPHIALGIKEAGTGDDVAVLAAFALDGFDGTTDQSFVVKFETTVGVSPTWGALQGIANSDSSDRTEYGVLAMQDDLLHNLIAHTAEEVNVNEMLSDALNGGGDEMTSRMLAETANATNATSPFPMDGVHLGIRLESGLDHITTALTGRGVMDGLDGLPDVLVEDIDIIVSAFSKWECKDCEKRAMCTDTPDVCKMAELSTTGFGAVDGKLDFRLLAAMAGAEPQIVSFIQTMSNDGIMELQVFDKGSTDSAYFSVVLPSMSLLLDAMDMPISSASTPVETVARRLSDGTATTAGFAIESVSLDDFEAAVSLEKPAFEVVQSEMGIRLATLCQLDLDNVAVVVDLPAFRVKVSMDGSEELVTAEFEAIAIDTDTSPSFTITNAIHLLDAMMLLEKVDELNSNGITTVQVQGSADEEDDLFASLVRNFHYDFALNTTDGESSATNRLLSEDAVAVEALSRFVLTTSDTEFRMEEILEDIDALFGDDIPVDFEFNMEGCELVGTNFDGDEVLMNGELSAVSLFGDEGSSSLEFGFWVDQTMSEAMVEMGKNIRDDVKAEEGLKVRGDFANGGGGISVVVSVRPESASRRSLRELSESSDGLDPSDYVESMELSNFWVGAEGSNPVLDLHCILDVDCDDTDVVVNLDGSVYIKALEGLPLQVEATMPAFKLGLRDGTVASTPDGEYTYFAGFGSSPLAFVSDEANTLDYALFMDLGRGFESVFKTDEKLCVGATIVAEMDRNQDLLHSTLSQMGVSFSVDLDEPTTAAIGSGEDSEEEASDSSGSSDSGPISNSTGVEIVQAAVFFDSTRDEILSRMETAFDLALDGGMVMPTFHIDAWSLSFLNVGAMDEDRADFRTCTSDCQTGYISMATLDVTSVATTYIGLNMSMTASDDGAMLGEMMSDFSNDRILELKLLRENVAAGASTQVANIVLPTKVQLTSLSSTWSSCMGRSGDAEEAEAEAVSRRSRRLASEDEELSFGTNMTDVSMALDVNVDDPLGTVVNFASTWVSYGRIMMDSIDIQVSLPAYGFEVVLTEAGSGESSTPLASSLSMIFESMEIDTVSSDGSFSIEHSVSAGDVLAVMEVTGADFVIDLKGESKDSNDLLSNVIGHVSLQFEVAVNGTAAEEEESAGRRLAQAAEDTTFVKFALTSDDAIILFDMEAWGMEELLRDAYFGVDLSIFVGAFELALADDSNALLTVVFDGMQAQLTEDAIAYRQNFGIHMEMNEDMVDNIVDIQDDVEDGTYDVQIQASSQMQGVAGGLCSLDVVISSQRRLEGRASLGNGRRILNGAASATVDEGGFFDYLFLDQFFLARGAPDRTLDLDCLADVECTGSQGIGGFDGGFKLREFELEGVKFDISLPALKMSLSTVFDGTEETFFGDIDVSPISISNVSDISMSIDVMETRKVYESLFLGSSSVSGEVKANFDEVNMLHIALSRILGDNLAFPLAASEDAATTSGARRTTTNRRHLEEESESGGSLLDDIQIGFNFETTATSIVMALLADADISSIDAIPAFSVQGTSVDIVSVSTVPVEGGGARTFCNTDITTSIDQRCKVGSFAMQDLSSSR
jgi:hypothetical protein